MSVAVKQAMPDHILFRTSMGFKFTNRNIPLSVFGLSFVMWAIGLVEGSYCTMFGSGLVISWVYLRFYQLHANGSRGKQSHVSPFDEKNPFDIESFSREKKSDLTRKFISQENSFHEKNSIS